MESLNPDFDDLIVCLAENRVSFIIVGAHALAAHGVARATGDLDVWYELTTNNATKLRSALVEFGAPVDALGWSVEELASPHMVFQLGQAPRRIDLLSEISGVEFGSASHRTIVRKIAGREVRVLGREDFLRNKRASGRPKDLLDIELLEESTD